MKRRFTILTAAFALLAILAIPMGMKAAEGDVHDMSITQSTVLNNNAAIPSINIDAQSYSVKKVTINWRYNKAIENPVTIEVLVGENSWGTQTITGNTTADAVFEGESTIGAIVINFTNNTGDGTGHGTFYVNSVKLTEGESSGPAPTTYTVTFDAGDGTFVGNTDFPNASNSVTAGTYTLPSATPATGYTFDGWAMGETTYQAGASYTVSGNADFVASYTESTTPTPGGPDVLNWVATGSPTSYTDWTYTAPSGAVYKGQSSGNATNQYIQLRSNNNNSGIVTTTSAGKVTNISVTWNSSTTSGRTLNVYGKNSAYSAATDLYGNNAGTLIGTIVYGTSTELIITDDYEYIGMRSASGAMYLDEIQITWESVTPTLVATPTFNPESGTEFGDDGLNVTITCETTDASIYYTLNGDTPDNQSTLYNGEISLNETTTIKAIAYDGTNYSNVATATYTYIDPNGPGTENNPYTVAQARAAIDAGTGTQGVYATGIVSSIVTAYDSGYENITFDMVDELGNEEFLRAYRCGGDEAANVAVGDVAVVYGNLTQYGSTYEFGQGCTLVSLTHPVITTPVVTVTPNTISAPFAGEEGTLTLAYENIENFTSFDYSFCDANGGELEGNDPDWINAEINENNDTYSLDYIIDANDGEVRTAYIKVYTYDDNEEEVYAIVTVNQATYEAPNVTWNLSIDETATATEDEMTWTSDYATMAVEKGSSSTNTNNYYPGTTGQSYTSTRFYKNSVLTIAPVAGYAITSVVFTATTESYANALTNSTWTNATASVEGKTVTITPTDGATAMGSAIGGTCGFTSVTVYYEENIAPQQYTLTIEGYGNSDGGYYLIASPVTVDPSTVGMTTGDFDLYSFDQAEDDEWRNYKAGAFTSLEPGKGYLYAHKTDGEFTLTGTAYNGEPIVLKKTAGGDFPGWNLVGNPYTETAYIDRDFYVMNSQNGGEIITGEGNEIAVMQGFFVIADQDGEELEISTTAPNTTGEKVIMNVTSNRGNVIDRAIVRFGEGRQLPKFQLRDNSTKISIAKDNSEYAVVRSEAEGEMPVSFKAENNGTYTFSVNTENVEMEYLHLIDNMTGADIDLIANPSYSFEAKVTDYASRFRLVFSANSSVNEQNANNFAFFNGNDWTINNEGEATLQVVDMTGRMLSTETINGNATTKVNAATGVYMLRLINGNNIKTQKVVVK